jgi:hypothetical protein
MEPNYLCPLSVYRRFADIRRSNPAKLFNPFTLANKFVNKGFIVELLLPFTAPYPQVTGNWLLGTTFWLRVKKL